MERILCRTFQYITKFGMYILSWKTPKVIKGNNSLKLLANEIKKDNCHNVMIVTGKTISSLGLFNPLLEGLEEKGIEYTIFNNVGANPTDIHVEDGVRHYIKHNCDAIVLFGGGSAMDAGKAIAARIARPDKTIKELQGLFKLRRRVVNLYAVPTTAGTGSETTMAAVVTDSKTKHKASINDLNLIPKLAVLDSTLTSFLPKHITAITAMDALTHAVEAYTNHIYNSKYENELCLKAVKLIHDNILKAYYEPNDLKARENMQLAAFYAGRAFTRGSVGYVHAIGHALSGLYDISHGLAMALLLPKVMYAYGEKAERHLAELAKVCNIGDDLSSNHDKAMAFIKWIEDLNKEMDISSKSLNINKDDIDLIVDWAHKEANPLYPTPKIWTKKDFRTFLEKIISE